MADYNDFRNSGLFLGSNRKWYSPTDEDRSSATSEYYGLIAADGTWVILNSVETSTDIWTHRYVTGHVDDYKVSWTNRASLTYKYYHELF